MNSVVSRQHSAKASFVVRGASQAHGSWALSTIVGVHLQGAGHAAGTLGPQTDIQEGVAAARSVLLAISKLHGEVCSEPKENRTCRARATLLAWLISRLTSRKGSLRQLWKPHSVHFTCSRKATATQAAALKLMLLLLS